VLARLSSITGALSARVDVTGRTFEIDLAGSDDCEPVVAEVEDLLGPGSRRLREPWCSAETERFDGDGDLWLDSASIRRLSLIEARMLSSNWGTSVARAAGLDRECADHLMMVMRRELVDEFDRVHEAGGTADRR